MSNLKLWVHVVSAHNLLPKDGQGSSNAFVEINFDGQSLRTTIKEKGPNPVWNESFFFNIFDASNLHHLTLDVSVYNSSVKATSSKTRSLLGKISLTGDSFVPYFPDAVVLHYPLKKHRYSFSAVRGELGLKVYVTDEPIAAVESLSNDNPSVADAHSQGVVLPNPGSGGNTSPNAQVETRLVLHPLYNPSHGIALTSTSPRDLVIHRGDIASTAHDHQHQHHPATEDEADDLPVTDTSPVLGSGRVVGWHGHGDRTASTSDAGTETRHTPHCPSPSLSPSHDDQQQQQFSDSTPVYNSFSPATEKSPVRGSGSVVGGHRDRSHRTASSTSDVGVETKNTSHDHRHHPPTPPSFSLFRTEDEADHDDVSVTETSSVLGGESDVGGGRDRTASTSGARVETRHNNHNYGPNPSHDQKHQQHPPRPPPAVSRHETKYETDDFALKETSPVLECGTVVGGRVIHRNKTDKTCDLVQRMHFLYVRVVKARDLPATDITGGVDAFVEAKIGNYRGITKHIEKEPNPEWNDVFAFSKDRLKASVLDVVVKDKDIVKDDFMGVVRFDIYEVPLRVPPDTPLAPQWYGLKNRDGHKLRGELMLAVWVGTQTDEAFPDAWSTDSASYVRSRTLLSSAVIGPKVYHVPKLWYVRVNVIEAHHLFTEDRHRLPDVYVNVRIGNQVSRTKTVQARNLNPVWNEDLLFVTAEPFEDYVVVSVEDRVGPGLDNNKIFGKVIIPLHSVERRTDDRTIRSRWYDLEKHVLELRRQKFSSCIHLRVCLEGGYHVCHESTYNSSDLRPSAEQLWRPSIGVLELGILEVTGLCPMKMCDGRATTDAYCVAKYGHKWFRTRTVIDNLCPKYNEPHSWEVFDLCTVLTVGVFDNNQLQGNGGKDSRIGKVRVPISSLESGRIYTHSYPLLILHPSGVKKMGELHLAIRFSCTSFAKMLYMYSQPVLPKMHYVRPLTLTQLESLRHQAVQIVAVRLIRAEPPLRREVLEYMYHEGGQLGHLWSMRRSKVNFFRVVTALSGLFSAAKWFGDICMWKNPTMTVLAHILFLMLVCYPELIFPTAFLYAFLTGLWNFRFRIKHPPHIDTMLSRAESTLVHLDELDEEFDTFPTSRPSDVVRMRYDRLRSIAGRVQTVGGDVASVVEAIMLLLSWRDTRATALLLIFCLVAALVLYVTPFKVVAALAGFLMMRHPRFRNSLLPSEILCFLHRMPNRNHNILHT